jgi:hypothetical protein
MPPSSIAALFPAALNVPPVPSRARTAQLPGTLSSPSAYDSFMGMQVFYRAAASPFRLRLLGRRSFGDIYWFHEFFRDRKCYGVTKVSTFSVRKLDQISTREGALEYHQNYSRSPDRN